MKAISSLLTSIVMVFLLSVQVPAAPAEQKEETPNTAELLKEGIITKQQKVMLDMKNQMAQNVENSLQNYSPKQNLNEGQIALQLQTQKEAPDMVCIANTGVLRVGIINEDLSPFVFTNKKGELDGIDIVMAKQIAKELGVQIEFVKADSNDAVVDLVIDKKVNMAISKLSITSDRSKKVRYAGSYVSLSKAMLVNRTELKNLNAQKNLTVQQLFDLPEASIGVVADTSYVQYAKTIFPKAKIVAYKRWDAVLDAMKKGEVLAAFRDEWEIRKAIQKDPKLQIFSETIVLKEQEDPIQMIVPWSSPQLAHFLDRFIMVNTKYHYDLDKLAAAYNAYRLQNQ